MKRANQRRRSWDSGINVRETKEGVADETRCLWAIERWFSSEMNRNLRGHVVRMQLGWPGLLMLALGVQAVVCFAG